VSIPGGRAGGPVHYALYEPGEGTVDKEITIPNLLYCSNFSYCCPPMWSCGDWQSEVAVHGSVLAPVCPFRFTMGGQSMPV
jgi:hypothetical protein